MAVDKLEGQALIEYVREAARLENGKYGTWRMEQELIPKIEELPRPKQGSPDKPSTRHKWVSCFKSIMLAACRTYGITLLVGPIATVIFIAVATTYGTVPTCVQYFPNYLKAATIVFILIAIKLFIRTWNSVHIDKCTYRKHLEEYIQRGQAEAERRYADEMAQKQYMQRIIDTQLRPAQERASQAVAKFYAQDVIFPKYRNMVAINQILEYLEAGRCDTLSGPNGAYNLYEQELQLNVIIDRMDVIIQQLEQIKQMQYMIYEALGVIGNTLLEINSELSGINANTSSIAVSSAVTAYNSKYCY